MSKQQKQPYVRFFASDWLAGTRGMRAAEVGVYITLIALMYERCEPLPEDSKRLARQCGCNPNTFTSILSDLIAEGKIMRVDGGGLWNNRVEKEFKWREKNSEQAREAAITRWEKENENKGRPMRPLSGRSADAMPNQNPESRIQNPKESTVPDGTVGERDSKPEKLKPKPTPQSELARALDAEHVAAVIEHRQRLRRPLTPHGAKLLANEFLRCRDPNKAADTMIARGWQGFRADWGEGRGQSPPGVDPEMRKLQIL